MRDRRRHSTAEDLLDEEPPVSSEGKSLEEAERKKREQPVFFNGACAERIAAFLGANLSRESRALSLEDVVDLRARSTMYTVKSAVIGVYKGILITPPQNDVMLKAMVEVRSAAESVASLS